MDLDPDSETEAASSSTSRPTGREDLSPSLKQAGNGEVLQEALARTLKENVRLEKLLTREAEKRLSIEGFLKSQIKELEVKLQRADEAADQAVARIDLLKKIATHFNKTDAEDLASVCIQRFLESLSDYPTPSDSEWSDFAKRLAEAFIMASASGLLQVKPEEVARMVDELPSEVGNASKPTPTAEEILPDEDSVPF